MHLTNATDYAVRVVVLLASEGRLIPSSEISRRMGIPFDYLRAVVAPLREAGIVASEMGSLGGYRLAARPEDVSLLDIIKLTEGTAKINRCLEHDRYCSRFATEACPVRSCYMDAQSRVEECLGAMTISCLVSPGTKEAAGRPVETGGEAVGGRSFST